MKLSTELNPTNFQNINIVYYFMHSAMGSKAIRYYEASIRNKTKKWCTLTLIRL